MGKAQQRINLLLAVWGEKYIRDFLQLSLPSLLAPGNIPALTQEHRTSVTFLTRSYDVDLFQQHPAFQTLAKICDIQFIAINDLLVISNYASILTMAFDRAIQQTGALMLQTYFIFLTSDYVMADGSFTGLLRYIAQGYSGIYAGNFQVNKEAIEPYLQQQIDPHTQVMAIKPRDLLDKCLPNLHPVSLSVICNQTKLHNYRANRFLYQHDQKTLGARFYLLHMLCIKPEVTDYQVHGFCDYTFMPAMCPSGNIARINDSDDYLVIEAQSKQHELDNIGIGPYDIKKLSLSLTEWTTKEHRQNALQTIYFHVNDLNPAQKKVIDHALDAFIQPIQALLQSSPPKPHQHHPYWHEKVVQYAQQIKSDRQCEFADYTYLTTTRLKQWFQRIVGTPPRVLPWHHRWLEYRSLCRYLAKNHPQNTIVLYHDYQPTFMHYCGWLQKQCHHHQHYYAPNLSQDTDKLNALQTHPFDAGIIFTHLAQWDNLTSTLSCTNGLLKPECKITVIIANDKNNQFEREVACQLVTLTNYRITQQKNIYNSLTLAGNKVIDHINHTYLYQKKIKFVMYALIGIPGGLYCFIKNALLALVPQRKGYCTHIILTLEKKPEVTI